MGRILVVDDDESILDSVSLILEEVGHRVETTPKGEDIPAKIVSFQPDVLLLDVLLSGNDGREICRSLKADVETKHLPVIMLSAHPTAKAGAMACGADDFLAKPFEMGELLQKIDACIADPGKNSRNSTLLKP